MKLFSPTMKFFSNNETNLWHDEIFLICKSGENPCGKPLLTKRKGTQVSYQYLRSNLKCIDNNDTVSNSFIWFHSKNETIKREVKLSFGTETMLISLSNWNLANCLTNTKIEQK